MILETKKKKTVQSPSLNWACVNLKSIQVTHPNEQPITKTIRRFPSLSSQSIIINTCLMSRTKCLSFGRERMIGPSFIFHPKSFCSGGKNTRLSLSLHCSFSCSYSFRFFPSPVHMFSPIGQKKRAQLLTWATSVFDPLRKKINEWSNTPFKTGKWKAQNFIQSSSIAVWRRNTRLKTFLHSGIWILFKTSSSDLPAPTKN